MTYIISQNENIYRYSELREAFKRLDESGDGYLQLEEMTAGLKEVLGQVKGGV